MQYIVRVRHDSGKLEDSVETHDTDSVVEKDLTGLADKATDAYVAAVKKYDAGHTVSLFRDGVTVHEALGTGTSRLSDAVADVDTAVKFGVAPAKVEAPKEK